MSTQPYSKHEWVQETRFGKWFLSTDIWYKYVLTEAFDDLGTLLKERIPSGKVLDAGCGQGQAFTLLEKYFNPSLIVGLDIDFELISRAQSEADKIQCPNELIVGTATQLPYPDNYFDTIFCHQLLHHVGNQMAVLKEFHRVLAPEGILLVCESCQSFIESYWVRWLFRHPMQAQKSAEEYIELVRSAGFEIGDQNINKTTPWWSLRDFGITQKLGIRNPESLVTTEVAMIADKKH